MSNLTDKEINDNIEKAISKMRQTLIMGTPHYEFVRRQDLTKNAAAMNFFKGVLRHINIDEKSIEQIEAFLQKEDNEG